MVRHALLIVGLGSLSGCLTTTFETGLPHGGARTEIRASYFLGGLIGDKRIDLVELCPDGVASFRDYSGFFDTFASCLTCDIYSPQTIEVECAGPAKVGFRLTPDRANHRTRVEPLPERVGGAS